MRSVAAIAGGFFGADSPYGSLAFRVGVSGHESTTKLPNARPARTIAGQTSLARPADGTRVSYSKSVRSKRFWTPAGPLLHGPYTQGTTR